MNTAQRVLLLSFTAIVIGIAAGRSPFAQTPAQPQGPAAGQGRGDAQGPAAARGQARGQGQAATPGAARGGGGQGDPWPGKKKVLAIADTQTGFHHDSISHALATIEQIGRQSGAYVTVIATDSQLITKTPVVGQGRYEGRGVNARVLPFYDAIFMLPSGYGVLTDEQKKDLLSFVHDDGKGIVVGHATGVAFTTWPEFGEMVGGYMDGEYSAEQRIIVEDPKFPGADAWPGGSFMYNEQHPFFKEPYSRDKVHVVLRIDPASMSEQNRAKRADGDYPVAFAKSYGKGRVFNMGWGHNDATWDDKNFQKLMLGVMNWAIGAVPADVTPRPLSGGAAR